MTKEDYVNKLTVLRNKHAQLNKEIIKIREDLNNLLEEFKEHHRLYKRGDLVLIQHLGKSGKDAYEIVEIGCCSITDDFNLIYTYVNPKFNKESNIKYCTIDSSIKIVSKLD